MDQHLSGLELILTPPQIDFANFLWYLVLRDENQFLHLELILGEVKFFYFLSKSLLEELPNINHAIIN